VHEAAFSPEVTREALPTVIATCIRTVDSGRVARRTVRNRDRQVAMTKKNPRYESRVFDGRIIHSAEIERIHKEVLDFKHIEAISEPMRELIEDLWPELADNLPPKAN